MTTTSTVVTFTGDRTLVIDPGVHLDELGHLAGELRRRGLRPTHGFSTHAHWDHLLWHEELGAVPRWASATTVERARADRRELLEEAARTAAVDIDRFGDVRAVDSDAIDGLDDVVVVVHDAHHPGHSALHLSDRRVLVAGDMTSDVEVPLLEHGIAGPEALRRYHQGLDVLAALDVDVVVTGHGTTCDGATWRHRLDADRRYLDDLAAGRPSIDERLVPGWLTEADRAMRELLDKQSWRRWVADLAEPDDATTAAVGDVVARLVASRPGTVAAYSALPGEVDLSAALEGLDPARVALPRIEGTSVTWHRDDGPLEPHRFGLLQPRADAPQVHPSELATVLVPGRAFDRHGVRLGRGGGHYDRLLPALSAGSMAVGVTVESRLVPRLPTESHDAPMTHLATEWGVRAVV